VEFEDDAKWQHFAFAADTSRVEALRGALIAFFETGDAAALAAFHDAHAQRFAEEEARVTIAAPEAIRRDVLARAVQAYAARRGSIEVHARPGPLPRRAWERVVSGSERATRLVELGAPEILVEAELDILRDALEGLGPPRPVLASAWGEIGPLEYLHGLFAVCVDLCMPPFPENVGVRGAYELWSPVARMVYGDGADPFVCDDLMPNERLVSADVAVLHTVADALPAGLLVGDSGPVACAHGEALHAFAAALKVPELQGRDTLEAASDEPNDAEHFRIVAGVDEEDLAANQEPLRERVARYREACLAMHARGETLLTWIAKNPAL
jgi:hypothetical protein